MSGVRLLARPLGCFDQRAVPEPEARLPLLQRGAEALDEVLVGVGGVELDETDSFRRPGEAQRQLPRDVGLARAGRPLKDDLTLVLEQLLDRAQVPQVEEQRLGDRPQVGRGLRHVVRVVHNIRVLFFRQITLDSPNYRLRFQAVAGSVQSPCRRLLDDPSKNRNVCSYCVPSSSSRGSLV